MGEGVLEPVERDAQADELLELVRPALAGAVEIGDGPDPVLAGRVDAAEEDAVLEDRVERQGAAFERDLLHAGIDAEQAGNAASAQEPEGVGHQLRVTRCLDDQVESAQVL